MSEFDYANDSMDSMLNLYLFESTTLLDQLDDILLQSESEENLSPENVNEIFRIMHTIKGSSAMMEFETISHVSHKLEDLFYVIRDKGLDEDFFQELFDLVLKVSDFLKEEVETIKQGNTPSAENEELIAEIQDLLDRMAGGSTPTESEASSTGQSSVQATLVADASADENQDVYYLHVKFTADCQMENIRAFMLVNKLQTAGKILETVPEELESNKDASSIILQNGFYVSLASDLSKNQISEIAKGTLSVQSVEFIDAMPNNAEKAGNQEAAGKVSAGPDSDTPKGKEGAGASVNEDHNKRNAKQANLINVDLNKLDTLMDLVGEIVITESMVSGSSDLAGLELENFSRASRQLRKLTDELQDIVMSIRMIPIAATFQKMRRIVRDMSKKLDKDAELILLGEATEVDKAIIDGISDPVMHLVRNAMDHAIEDRETRIDSGKDPVGRIILSAQNVGGDIIITVNDDGKGLDPEMILAKARDKKLLTKPENEYTEKEIFNLLTVPGFSTKESVTEFSGRGVGMDVVKKNIEKIGGSVTIESVKGVGTNIFFKIPLTLAIISSMEIRIGDTVCAIPIANIRESFKPVANQLLKDPDGNEMILIRGECYPIIRPHRTFHIKGAQENILDGVLMLVDSGNSMACILADELLGKHQVVVKPLPNFLNRFSTKGSGIAGCTIMGDGSICLILDIQGILNQY